MINVMMILFAAGSTLAAPAEVNLLTNADFEAGEGKAPVGWTKPATGEWAKGAGVDDSSAIGITGTGSNSEFWASAPVEFQPGHCYRFSFLVRGVDTASGTVISGPQFANVDVGTPSKSWQRESNVFVTPIRKEECQGVVRLGQWQMGGTAFFDNARLVPVLPVHAHFGELALGEGETLNGNVYTFNAPFSTFCRNHSRPLAWHHGTPFNSQRWCMGEGSAVIYKHELAGRNWTNGTVNVSCGYHVGGKALVDVSKDAKEWVHLGAVTNTGDVKLELPATLFPAETLFVRLRGGKDCGLQIYGYGFSAGVGGEAVVPEAVGRTQYIEIQEEGQRLHVEVRDLGNGIPGLDNRVALFVQNKLGTEVETNALVIFSAPGKATITNTVPVKLPASGAFDVAVPYECPGTGEWTMTVALGAKFRAQGELRVPSFYDDSYGELIPVGNKAFNLWRASSGWKIPQHRSLPKTVAKSLSLKMARNEAEAVQLVVTPNQTLTNLTVTAGDLAGAGGKIPAADVEILRVGYVPVEKPTDQTGVRAEWPDPLLPQDGALNVGAGINQPFWIRVKAPKGTPAGIYRGRVQIKADGVNAVTVLNAEVYDFDLPDKMTCQTSFGFDTGRVKQYQKLEDGEQFQGVIGKYLQALADHHLSPYNPAPFAHWSVGWTGLPQWRGGVLTNEGAVACMKVVDDSTTENRNLVYGKTIALPPKGMKVSFRYKQDKAQASLLSLGSHRADGSWMSGCNRDIDVPASAEWKAFEATYSEYPKDAAATGITFYPAGYRDSGETVGTMWIADLKVTDADGKSLIEGGDFKPWDANKAEPVFDWAAWDKAMEEAFAKYHFNTFVIGIDGLGGGTFQNRWEPHFMGFPASNPAYDILMGKYLKGVEAHLKEKGWLDMAYVYWFDEPDEKDYAFVMNGFQTLKRYAPGLRRMLTEQPEKALAGGPNLWCPLTPSLNTAETPARRAAGDQFWWYVCCGPHAPYVTEFIDHPGSEMRLWLWQTWGENVGGVLIWTTDWWTSDTAFPDRDNPQNPYKDAMSWVGDGSMAPGTKAAWGNGDGRFLYPPLAAADSHPAAVPVLDGPNSCVRLEMLRDGLEDYEYFAILQRLLKEKGAKLDVDTRAKTEALLAVPKDVYKTMTSFTVDPAPMETHRDALARAIVDLMKL